MRTFCPEEQIDKKLLEEIIQQQTRLGSYDKITCFNCSEQGHYANMCPKKKDRFA
jgi:hypothetical protein